ncbi:WSC domain-containing protein [Dichotomopilus funicola]|uniref:WSC domain-containing protein n=1 Tax=Dichotomopilus funicola TaxID=1934379 RepID=A0AAN6UYS6_9PEZI|nr:WSC domain-containing protein [Dichotomopilus funicola]
MQRLTLALAPAAALAQTYYGCYTEIPARALTGSSLIDYEGMTIAVCETHCTGLGFDIWGVEYGGECYCGNALAQGSFPAFSTDCTMPCPGDTPPTTTTTTEPPTETPTDIPAPADPARAKTKRRTTLLNPRADTTICGGPNRLSLYGTSPDPPTVTPYPHPAVGPTPSYLGCWTELTDALGLRTLPGASGFSPTDMTVAGCGSYCLNNGFEVFGLEYGAECYCGAELNVNSTSVAEAECGMACSGAAEEVCGGSNRLSVWEWVAETEEK